MKTLYKIIIFDPKTRGLYEIYVIQDESIAIEMATEEFITATYSAFGVVKEVVKISPIGEIIMKTAGPMEVRFSIDGHYQHYMNWILSFIAILFAFMGAFFETKCASGAIYVPDNQPYMVVCYFIAVIIGVITAAKLLLDYLHGK